MENQQLLKKILPHAIAVVVLLLIACIYMMSAVFEGKKLVQHDIVQWSGMAKEVTDYREKHNDEALWTNRMFGGMPAFQISLISQKNLLQYIDKVLEFGLPTPADYLFLMMIGAYILFVILGVSPWVALTGSIAYGLTSFFIISIEAGHNNKVHAIAYMAPVISGVILAYRGKILVGAAITGLFLALQIGCNHIQITYYLALFIAIAGISFFVEAIKSKTIPAFALASGALLVAALLALAPNATRLMTSYEYQKETIRGGSSELSAKAAKTKGGLDWDYATSWSYGKLETFTLLIPNFMGGATGEKLGSDSKLAKKGLPKNALNSVPTYWGDQPFTSGPTYFGAIVCFLFILGFLLIQSPVRWAMLGATILSFFLAWGRNFEFFNQLLFEYLPMYNKFRTPSMAMVIAQLAIPLLGFLGLQQFFFQKTDKQQLLKKLYLSAGITGGLVLIFGVMGSFVYDFSGAVDQRLASMGWPIDALRADRAAMLRADSFRSLFLIAIAVAVLWAWLQQKLKMPIAIGLLGIFILGDMWMVSKRYLDAEDFVSESQYKNQFNPSKADAFILNDQSGQFRVLNLTKDYFNDALTSYFHNSIGGYHAAKLIRYQDLKEYQLDRQVDGLKQLLQGQPTNDAVQGYFAQAGIFNMLNTKYIIYNPDAQPLLNPSALGNAWFVSNLTWVENADEEMAALTRLDPAKTAVADKRFKPMVGETTQFSEGTISQTSYSPKKITYEAGLSETGLVVFSEVYYNSEKGWQAYLNGNPVEHFRVNYVLRGMVLPPGNHQIEFRFEPQSYFKGESIALFGSLLLLLLFPGSVYLSLRRKNTTN